MMSSISAPAYILMLRPLLSTAVLIATAVVATAQPESAASVHRIPFGSQANSIDLAVANASADREVGAAAVVLVSTPEWLTVSPARLDLGALAPGAESMAAFTLDLDRRAPVGEEGTVVFDVIDGSGAVLQRKTVRVQAAAPDRLALSPPYPNPARGEVTVPFEMPAAGEVRVAVYDALGREVAVLHDGEAEPGAHEATLAAGALAAGAYVVRVTSGEASDVVRLAVVR